MPQTLPLLFAVASLALISTACGPAESLPPAAATRNTATQNTATPSTTATPSSTATSSLNTPTSTPAETATGPGCDPSNPADTDAGDFRGRCSRPKLSVDHKGWDLREVPRTKHSSGKMKVFGLEQVAHHTLKNQDSLMLIADREPIVFDFAELSDVYIQSETIPSCLRKWPYERIDFHLDGILEDGAPALTLAPGATSTQLHVVSPRTARAQVAFDMSYRDGPLREFDAAIKDPDEKAICQDIWGPSDVAPSTMVHYRWALDVRELHDIVMSLPPRCQEHQGHAWAVAGAGAMVLRYMPLDAIGTDLRDAKNWNGSDAFDVWYHKTEVPEFNVSSEPYRLGIDVPQLTSDAVIHVESSVRDLQKLRFVPPSEIAEVDVALFELQSENEARIPYTPGMRYGSDGLGGESGIEIGIASVGLKNGAKACNFEHEASVEVTTPEQCQQRHVVVGHGLRRHPYSIGKSVVPLKEGLCEFVVALPGLGIKKSFSVRFEDGTL